MSTGNLFSQQRCTRQRQWLCPATVDRMCCTSTARAESMAKSSGKQVRIGISQCLLFAIPHWCSATDGIHRENQRERELVGQAGEVCECLLNRRTDTRMPSWRWTILSSIRLASTLTCSVWCTVPLCLMSPYLRTIAVVSVCSSS
jgi:hypothetical protein